MANALPPVRGSSYDFEVALISQADTDIFQTSVTLAAGDVQISKDGGAFANVTNLPVEIGTTGVLTVSLSAAEMTADRVTVLFHDAAGAEWQDALKTIYTSAQTFDGLDAVVADAVWDEVLTSGTHDVGYSAGQRLRYLILSGDAAQAGTSNTITLAAAESATDNIFTNNLISLVGGTGAGQTRVIVEYDGGTRVATVDQEWDTNPDATTIYEILPFAGVMVSGHGVATGGGASTITLAGTASAIDDTYIGSVIYIAAGTGAGQARVVTDYDGGTQAATVSDAWTTQPIAGSVYKVLPVGRTIVDSISAAAEAQVNAEVLDVLNVDTFAELAAVPAATATLVDKLTWLFQLARNRVTQTGTVQTLYADDETTAVGTAAVSDDGTTFDKEEYS